MPDDTVDIKPASSDEQYIVTLVRFDYEEYIITRGYDGNLTRKTGHSNEDK